MGFLDIQNMGRGYIGAIGEDWSIAYSTSPMFLGMGIGRHGTLTFSAECDATTRFSIDNYLTVRHYFDDQVNRWLSTFDAHVRGVDISAGNFADFTALSRVSALDVERTASVNPTGTYLRRFTPPAGESYTISATPYLTPESATVYDVTVEPGRYVYLLAEGTHGGEVVHQFEWDGTWVRVWPVYSDATDLANPQSRYIAYSNSRVFVAQVAADRVKSFNYAFGTYVTQWGSAGTGNGQFGTISDITADINAVYVLDSALGRTQRFGFTGTYVQQFGSSGTGSGQQTFNAPNNIEVFSGRLFISDARARVREYGLGGVYYSQPLGGWDFTNSVPLGEYAGSSRIACVPDYQTRGVFGIQSGKLHKYLISDTPGSTEALGDYLTNTRESYAIDASTASASDINNGLVYSVSADGKSVIQYVGSTQTYVSLALYYIALAIPDFPIRMLQLNNPEMTAIGWTGSVWQMLGELTAVASNSITALDDRINIFDRSSDDNFQIPNDAVWTPLSISTSSTAQAVEAINLNAIETGNGDQRVGVVYDTVVEGRDFSASLNSIDNIVVSQDTYPEYLLQPSALGSTANPFENPSVEVDLANIGYYTNGGSVTLTRSTAQFFDGVASARLNLITAPTDTYVYISNKVTVVPGQAYDFRLWGKLSSGTNQQMRISVSWWDAADNYVDGEIGPSIAVNNDWTEFKSDRPQVAPPTAAYAHVHFSTGNNPRAWVNGESLYADAWSDGPFTVADPTDPAPTAGRYIVRDSDGLLVDPADWRNSNARVVASVGERPGDINLDIFGPQRLIPGKSAPFTIHGLSVVGIGIVTKPETLRIGTGVPESVSVREVGMQIESPFISNAAIAYTQGAWAAYRISNEQGYTVRFRNNTSVVDSLSALSGSAQIVNRMVTKDGAQYLVDSVRANNSDTELTLYLCTRMGGEDGTPSADPELESIWANRTAGEFDTFWAGYDGLEFHVMPLREPFGVYPDPLA